LKYVGATSWSRWTPPSTGRSRSCLYMASSSDAGCQRLQHRMIPASSGAQGEDN
jgi:hypothetical protein